MFDRARGFWNSAFFRPDEINGSHSPPRSRYGLSPTRNRKLSPVSPVFPVSLFVGGPLNAVCEPVTATQERRSPRLDALLYHLIRERAGADRQVPRAQSVGPKTASASAETPAEALLS